MTSVVSGLQDDGVQEESRAGIRTAVDAVPSTAPFPSNKLVSAAEWLHAGLEEGIQERDVQEVADVQDGMKVVCIAADGGEGEARIVELDDKEDDLVASENGIATLDV